MIDTHAHLFYFDEIELKDIFEHDLDMVINCSTSIENLEVNHNLYLKYPEKIKLAVGIHPECTNDFFQKYDEFLKKLEDFIKMYRKDLSAVGECGLDYYHRIENIDAQKQLLRDHVRIAETNRLPIILHARNNKDATFSSCILDTLAITGIRSVNDQNLLDKSNLDKYIQQNVMNFLNSSSGVFHCFTGTLDEAKAILEAGYYIGFTNILTYKNSIELREVFSWVWKHYPQRVMLETDSPYLPPAHNRGKKCFPYDVEYVYEFIKSS